MTFLANPVVWLLAALGVWCGAARRRDARPAAEAWLRLAAPAHRDRLHWCGGLRPCRRPPRGRLSRAGRLSSRKRSPRGRSRPGAACTPTTWRPASTRGGSSTPPGDDVVPAAVARRLAAWTDLAPRAPGVQAHPPILLLMFVAPIALLGETACFLLLGALTVAAAAWTTTSRGRGAGADHRSTRDPVGRPCGLRMAAGARGRTGWPGERPRRRARRGRRGSRSSTGATASPACCSVSPSASSSIRRSCSCTCSSGRDGRFLSALATVGALALVAGVVGGFEVFGRYAAAAAATARMFGGTPVNYSLHARLRGLLPSEPAGILFGLAGAAVIAVLSCAVVFWRAHASPTALRPRVPRTSRCSRARLSWSRRSRGITTRS